MRGYWLGFGVAIVVTPIADGIGTRPPGAIVAIFGLVIIIASMVAELVSRKTPHER